MLVDELMSAGMSVLGITNAVLEVGESWQISCPAWPMCLVARY